MRHRHGYAKLGRQPAHRRQTLRNLVINLLERERVSTTLAKAKAMRPVAEKMITLGKRDTLHSRRQAAAYLTNPEVVQKLFATLAPRFADRPGGYTRLVHAGWRRGDGGETAIVELIGSELKVKTKKKKEKKARAPEPEAAPPEAEAGTEPAA